MAIAALGVKLLHERMSTAQRVAVGFALFFPVYSTFKTEACLHLEDLFVLPEHRGAGIGEALLRALSPVLVITQSLCDVCAVHESLVSRAIRDMDPPAALLSVSPGRLDEVIDSVRDVAAPAGEPARGDELRDSLRARLGARADYTDTRGLRARHEARRNTGRRPGAQLAHPVGLDHRQQPRKAFRSI